MEISGDESKALRLEVMLEKALKPIIEELLLIEQKMAKMEEMQKEVGNLLKEKNITQKGDF